MVMVISMATECSMEGMGRENQEPGVGGPVPQLPALPNILLQMGRISPSNTHTPLLFPSKSCEGLGIMEVLTKLREGADYFHSLGIFFIDY